MIKPTLPMLMGLNGGFVDTVGFLALHGLFTAHVTGNFVTLGAALVMGTSGVVAKLLALPVFCIVIVVARVIGFSLRSAGLPVLRIMLTVKLLLLTLAAVLAIHHGPFPTGDSLPAIATGMVLVAAMAIQNAAQRIHMSHTPPATVMTGTTTQVMIDIGDLVYSHGFRNESAEAKAAVWSRLRKMSASVFVFCARLRGRGAGVFAVAQLVFCDSAAGGFAFDFHARVSGRGLNGLRAEIRLRPIEPGTAAILRDPSGSSDIP